MKRDWEMVRKGTPKTGTVGEREISMVVENVDHRRKDRMIKRARRDQKTIEPGGPRVWSEGVGRNMKVSMCVMNNILDIIFDFKIFPNRKKVSSREFWIGARAV
jgi:hypothetical protein